MDAQEFHLCFGASYVMICQIELKLLKYNYENWFILARVLCRIVDLYHMTSLYIMYLVLIQDTRYKIQDILFQARGP